MTSLLAFPSNKENAPAFHLPSASSASSASHSQKRRKSTGIIKLSSASNTASNNPPADDDSFTVKKKRRNVSFGGAHVRVFDKSNSANTIDLASVLHSSRQETEEEEEEDDEDEEEDAAITFKTNSMDDADGDDVTMDFTRSFTAPIHQPAIEEEEEGEGEDDGESKSNDSAEMSMDLTKAFTTSIYVNPLPTTNTTNSPDHEEVTMDFTQTFTTFIQQMEGEDDKKMEQNENDENANESEMSMDLTRAFTSTIQVFPRRVAHRASLLPALTPTSTTADLTSKFESNVLDILHAQKSEATAELPSYNSMSEKTKNVANMIKGILQGKEAVMKEKEEEQEEEKEETAPALTPAAEREETAPAPTPTPASASASAPAPAPSSAPSTPAVAWPPQSLESWLETYFISLSELEDVQASCLHLIDSTDTIQTLTKKMEEWITEHEQHVPLFNWMQSMPAAQSIAALFKKGQTPTAEMAESKEDAELGIISRASNQFHQRMQLESAQVWSDWRYKLVELSYQRLMDAQQLLQKDKSKLESDCATIEGQRKQLVALCGEESRDLRNQVASNCKKLVQVCREYAAIKSAEREAMQRQDTLQSRLTQRVLMKAQQLQLDSAESDLKQLTQMVGFKPLYLRRDGIKIQFHEGRYELEVGWDATDGNINREPTIKYNAQLSAIDAKDAPFFTHLFNTCTKQSLHAVLGAIRDRKQVAIVLPHILHLLGRMESLRSDLSSVRRQFNVRSSPVGTLELTVTCVRSLAQVIVFIDASKLLRAGPHPIQSMLRDDAGGDGRSISIIAMPHHLSAITEEIIRGVMDETSQEVGYTKITNAADALLSLLAQ